MLDESTKSRRKRWRTKAAPAVTRTFKHDEKVFYVRRDTEATVLAITRQKVLVSFRDDGGAELERWVSPHSLQKIAGVTNASI